MRERGPGTMCGSLVYLSIRLFAQTGCGGPLGLLNMWIPHGVLTPTQMLNRSFKRPRRSSLAFIIANQHLCFENTKSVH